MTRTNTSRDRRGDRGYLVVEHAIDQIVEARTYRTELGDLAELTASVQRLGLLCPIVITVDGVLISGRRRLAAMRRLGHTTVPVWVAAGVSDELRTLLAIQDDNLLRKDLTTTEKAALYEEYKAVLAEENARRQRATRFGADHSPETHPASHDDGDSDSDGEERARVGDGGGDSQPPSRRKSRVQAAEAVTGRDSSQQLEEVLELQRLAVDEAEHIDVRQAAADALVEINTDGKVHGRFQDVKTLQALRWLEGVSLAEEVPAQVRESAATEVTVLRQIERRAERVRAAITAAARVRDLLTHATGERDGESPDGADTNDLASGRSVVPSATSVRAAYQCRRLVEVFTRAGQWWSLADPVLVGVHASDEQWQLITEHHRQASAFIDAAETARTEAS